MLTRRRALSLAALIVLAGITAAIYLPAGCSSQPRLTDTLARSDERSRRLLALAADEAAGIADVDARLTRQLNFADRQIARGWHADARTTLAAARQTLDSPDADALNDHARISGYVSVSELSRAAGDNAGAAEASRGAVERVLAIEDEAARCQYVMGVANELQYLAGIDAAADFLHQAGPWTRQIDDLAERRRALVSFASALFNLDDYARGQALLRQDDDATWRSDTLVTLASNAEPASGGYFAGAATPNTVELMSGAPSRDAAAKAAQPFYGRQLDYKTIFRNRDRSQTQQD